ncbi:hypothetical protein RB595_003990 [Gaeumannomyces hyphopodioides]
MPFEFGLCEPEDMDRCFEVLSLAFGHDHPYVDALFPAHDTPQGRADGAQWLSSSLRDRAGLGRAARLCKAVDTDTGAIVGFAKWDVYDGFAPDVGPGSLKGDQWRDKDAKEYADYIWWEFTRRRWAALKESGGHLVCECRPYACTSTPRGPLLPLIADRWRATALDIMSVDPAYQRRGVGAKLMKYGVDEADRLGVEAVVEASRMGRYLYETFGFEIREDILIPNPPKRAGQPEQFIHWMTRPARKI